MHVVVATDGSRASLDAARQFQYIADSREITDVTVVAVVSPLATVPFANELAPTAGTGAATELSWRTEADASLAVVAAVFDGWGPTIHRLVRNGSPASEIVALALEVDAGLIALASGSSGLTDRILLGSTAQRVQYSAPCPVLVGRPTRTPFPA